MYSKIEEVEIENYFWESLSSSDALAVAQKFFEAREYEKSLRWYKLVTKFKDTDNDEMFESHLKVSECMMILNYDFEKIYSEIKKTVEVFPDRAEPHFLFGRHCNAKEEATLAYQHLLIAKSFDLDYVKSKYNSFITDTCYGKFVNDELSVACYALSKFDEGLIYLNSIINDPDFSQHRERLEQNLFFFKRELSERELINSFFEPGYKGVFIDVGSAHPIYRNKSYYYESAGWEVYCIEPNRKLYEKSKGVRKNVYNFACGSDSTEKAEFTICTLADGTQEAITSLNVNKRLLRDLSSNNPILETTKVEVKALKSFIDKEAIEKVDVISIDTEGTELEVLVGLDLSVNKPKVLIVENNYEVDIIQSYLTLFGYTKIARIHVNDYYLLKEDVITLDSPTIKYVSSGNFGDLIHQLYVIKNVYERAGIKGDLFLMDGYPDPWKEPDWDKRGAFQNGAKNTSHELKLLLEKQEYINNVSEYKDYIGGMIHLNPWMYLEDNKRCWTETFSDCFNLPYPKSYIDSWLNIHEKNPKFVGKVVIHESLVEWRKFDDFPWLDIIDNNVCVFVSFDEEQYNNFKYKDRVHFHKMENFEECCLILNSCKFYVGNLTSITAIARAMNIPSLVELTTYKSFDAWHYIGEEEYWKNFFYIDDIHPSKIQKISNFINCSIDKNN